MKKKKNNPYWEERWKQKYTDMCKQYILMYKKYLEAENRAKTYKDQLDYEGVDPKPVSDPWGGCACGSSSTCGTTFTVDKSGVIDRPNLPEGRYTVLIKKETNTL